MRVSADLWGADDALDNASSLTAVNFDLLWRAYSQARVGLRRIPSQLVPADADCSEQPVDSRVATLLLTDLVDSTSLERRLGPARAIQVLREHASLARTLLSEHEGIEIDKTDGFLLLFETPDAALRFALAYHESLALHREAWGVVLKARSAIHTAEVELFRASAADVARGAKPLDVEGLAKPLAARVMALAQGGQVLLTAEAKTLLAPERYRISACGLYRLKGIEGAIPLFEAVRLGSGPLGPPADAPSAYRLVADDDHGLRPAREIPRHLPCSATSFVGRREELARLCDWFANGTRLVTILGPGGVGKTRLSTEFARIYLGDFPHGAFHCDLTDARSAVDIVAAVAQALDVRLGDGEPFAQLERAIAARSSALIVLDNFEQILPHAEGTVGRWLARSTGTRFLVTSRAVLQLPQESLLELGPLPVPAGDGGRELAENFAAQLFVDRACAVVPDFELNGANRKSVAEVIRLLDGLPLALELAAARMRVLSPRQILERVSDRFRVLDAGRIGAKGHTLRATIDWSWDLLEPHEQAALAQCSVFRGGFALESAERVLDLSSIAGAPPTTDVVRALADKSLLQVQKELDADCDTRRFGVLVSIEQYASEKLGQPEIFYLRHAQHFARLGTREALQQHDVAPPRLRRALVVEAANLDVALKRAVDAGWGRLSGPLALAWATAIRGSAPLGSLVERLEALSQVPGMGLSDRAAVLCVAARHCLPIDRTDKGQELFKAAFECARESNDELAELSVSIEMNSPLACRHHYARALAEVRAARARAEAVCAGAIELRARVMEACLMLQLGSIDSREAAERARELARLHGNLEEESGMWLMLGILAYTDGRFDEGCDSLAAAVVCAEEANQLNLASHVLAVLADAQQQAGRITEARKNALRALAVLRTMGALRSQGTALYAHAMACMRDGDTDEARKSIAESVQCMREVDDRHELCIALSCRVHIELQACDRSAAAKALEEAESLLASLRVLETSEPGRRVAGARAALVNDVSPQCEAAGPARRERL